MSAWTDVFVNGTNDILPEYRGIENDYWLHYTLKPGDVFFQGGGFWGRTVTLARDKVAMCKRIVLIEPSPDNIRITKRYLGDILSGQQSNVTLVEKALSNKKGTAKFWMANDQPAAMWTANRLLEFVDQSGGEIIDIETDTVTNIANDLGLDTIDLIGWDIEGAGNIALEGCTELLEEKRIKNLSLDCSHIPETNEFAIETLQSHGYRIVFSRPGFVYATCEG